MTCATPEPALTSRSAPVLLLGSASPRRQLILETLRVPVEVVVSEVEEVHDLHHAQRTVTHNARLKHAWCRERHPGRWTLTADTVVEFEGRVLGKPRDLEEARSMLLGYSGKCQTVHTAVALSGPKGRPDLLLETTRVRFQVLTAAQVDQYVLRVLPLDRAGAYDIHRFGHLIVERFDGSFTNVMGLPGEAVRDWLSGAGYPLDPRGRLVEPPRLGRLS